MPESDTESPAASPPPVRVVLSGLPQLLAGILKATIHRHPDLALVDVIPEGDLGWDDQRSIAADVVLRGAHDPADGTAAREILYAAPNVRVLQVTASGDDTVVFELRPRRAFLGELSPDQLVDAIRSRIPGNAEWEELEV